MLEVASVPAPHTFLHEPHFIDPGGKTLLLHLPHRYKPEESINRVLEKTMKEMGNSERLVLFLGHHPVWLGFERGSLLRVSWENLHSD